MKKKCLVISAMLLLTINAAVGQDTSRLIINHLNNGDSLTPVDAAKGAANPNPATDKSHSEVNINKGTMMPNTTSGTLNSSVNPNTQFVIPFNKKKKKTNTAANSSPATVNGSTSVTTTPATATPK